MATKKAKDTPTITIDMDKACRECGQMGAAAENGLCLECTAGEVERRLARKGPRPRIDHTKLNKFATELEEMMDRADGVAEEIKVLMEIAKLAGFAPRGIKQVVKERRLDTEERAKIEAHEMTVDMYRQSLGLEPAHA